MEPFKERISPAVVERIGDLLLGAWPQFPRAPFVRAATEGLAERELKDRVRHVAAALHAHLPPEFPRAARLLTAILSDHINPEPDDGTIDLPFDPQAGLRGMPVWVLTHYIGAYGLEHVDPALDALAQMTSRCTSEFDVRPFIAHHPDATWARIEAWRGADDVHLRRLASEGTRPYLPWATRVRSLIDTPDRNFALLEGLKDDRSSYVRRSVANHLNDLSRDHRERVIETARRWLSEREARRPLVKHALRTLSKRSDPEALALFGFDPNDQVELSGFELGDAVREGERLPYTFRLTNRGDAPAPILVEAVLHYVKARGTRSPKVFQITRTELAPGQGVEIARRHDFRPVTTRRHYAGVHRLEVRVNGRVRAGGEFTLEVEVPSQ